MKGVSSTVIFVVVAIALFVGAGIIVFWKWMDLQGLIANESSCILKQKSYCVSLINGENPNWDEINPKTGCEKFGIVQPSSDDCKRLT